MATNTLLTSPDQVLSAARYKACYDLAPYYAIALHNCIPSWVKGLGSIAISDRMHLLIDPDQWMKWYQEAGLDVCAWILIHEVNHPLREHADRARRMGITAQNASICNACEDAEINDDFPDPRKNLPEGFCWLPEDLHGQTNGKTWEEYYANLPKDKNGKKYIPDHPSLGKDRPDKADGDQGNPKPQDGGQCGSGATGHPVAGEPPGAGQGTSDDPSQPQTPGSHDGRSPADIERIRNQVAAAVQDHIASHGRGSVPAGISRWADQRLKPPVIPWQQQIRRASRFCVAEVRGQQDYDYRKPSRRQAGMGYGIGKPILPRMFAPVPEVVIGVDTSGSMGQDDLLAAMSEVDSIMKLLGVPVDILTCDAAVHVSKKVRSIRDACQALVGGGGTDFRPFFDAIKDGRRRNPDILAIFTDGDGPAPQVNPLPGTRILWIVVGEHGIHPYTETGSKVSYGTVIFVPPDAGKKKAA